MDLSEKSSPIESGIVAVCTTFGSREAALACADRLVHARLAACVQVDGPITSTYVWQGAVERADEWRCVCKTSHAGREACVAAILAGHVYETPQIVVVPVEAATAYAAWIKGTVHPEVSDGL